MKKTEARAREMLPAIIITVLSMIQALALELFWSRFQDSEYLWLGGVDALVGWLQVSVVLLGIIQVWLVYVSLMLRFSWIPSMADTTVPFAIGLLEFLMIDLTDPATVGPWLVVLGVLFGIALASTRMSLRKARRDPENHWFFQAIPPASLRDHATDISIVIGLLLLGVLVWTDILGTPLVVAGTVCALLALGGQLYTTYRYWLPQLTMRGERTPDQDA